MTVVKVLDSMTSKSEQVVSLLCHLTIKSLDLNIVVRSSHLEGACNNICDTLSCQQFICFSELVPEADTDPTPFPGYLWNVFREEPRSCYKQYSH